MCFCCKWLQNKMCTFLLCFCTIQKSAICSLALAIVSGHFARSPRSALLNSTCFWWAPSYVTRAFAVVSPMRLPVCYTVRFLCIFSSVPPIFSPQYVPQHASSCVRLSVAGGFAVTFPMHRCRSRPSHFLVRSPFVPLRFPYVPLSIPPCVPVNSIPYVPPSF